MRIAIGSDHLGLELKAAIIEALEQDEHAVLDLGTHGPSPTDYPPIVRVVATAMMKNFVDLGILVCDSGLGASIAGNRFQGVRAVSCHDTETARRGRERLDVNMICLGATEIDNDTAVAMIRDWAGTKFLGEENDTRILARIAELEDARTSGRRVSGTMAKGASAPASGRAQFKLASSAPERNASSSKPQSSSAPQVWDIQDEDAANGSAGAAAAAPSATAPSPAPAPAPAPSPVVDSSPRPSDITAVMKVVAGIKEPETKLIATRVLQFLRNRFPAANGTPTDNGFTFTLADQHVATVKIGRNYVELEAGPDHVPTSKLRDPEGLEMHLSLPSITKALDAVAV